MRKPVTPARAVFDRMRLAIGWRTDSDVIATTRPHPCACIAGTAALHIATTASEVGVERALVGVDRRRGEVAGGWPAAVRHEDVDAAERLGRRGHERRRPVGGADVGDDRDAAVADDRRRLGEPIGVAAADGDVRTFRGQGHRRGEPESRRCRRHRGPTTVQSEIHARTVDPNLVPSVPHGTGAPPRVPDYDRGAVRS